MPLSLVDIIKWDLTRNSDVPVSGPPAVSASAQLSMRPEYSHWETGPDFTYPVIGQPIIVTGSYTPGPGGGAFVHLGFTPDFVLIKANASSFPVWKCLDNWYDRSDYLHSALSANRITSMRDGGFTVTNNAEVGAAGTTYYFLAVADNGRGMLKSTSLFGNGATRTLSDWLTAEPSFLLVKRDNANPAITRWAGMGAVSCRPDGQGTSSGISAIDANGVITLTSAAEVNELTPPGLGEACAFVAFQANEYCQVTNYTGDGTASRAIALNWQPEFVWVAAEGGTPKGAQIAMAALPSGTTIAGSNAAQALVTGGRITITATGFTINNDTGVNNTGTVYRVFALRRNAPTPALLESTPNKPAKRKRQAVFLTGSNSWIDCGVSDTLKMVGTMTLEWQGAIELPSYVGQDAPLIVRASGDAAGPGTQGQVSWGVTSYQRAISDNFSPQSSVEYKGYTFRPIVSTFFDLYETGSSNPAAATNWDVRYSPFNSGVLVPQARRFHLMLVTSGLGVWRLYINGRLVKDRNINLVAALGAQNLNSPSGHRTVIGARAINNGTSIVNSIPMLFEMARVYSSAFTSAQVLQRYRRGFLGQQVADVTSGLVEEWDAANASRGRLLATVDPANNGTISGGTVVTL